MGEMKSVEMSEMSEMSVMSASRKTQVSLSEFGSESECHLVRRRNDDDRKTLSPKNGSEIGNGYGYGYGYENQQSCVSRSAGRSWLSRHQSELEMQAPEPVQSRFHCLRVVRKPGLSSLAP